LAGLLNSLVCSKALLRNWRSSESITQATSRTQQITLASANSRINAGSFAVQARLVSKITGCSRSA
jgi:hypothetical protein